MPKLTLAEMAARYKCCTKTFHKHVIQLKIPHEKLGRTMHFEPVKVEQYLERISVPAELPDLKSKKLKNKPTTVNADSSRYASMLGL